MHLRRWGVDTKRFWEVFHDEENPKERAEHTFLYRDARVVEELDTAVGLVTHCQPYLAEPVLSSLDIADWFDVIICCNDELGWKPDPAPIERAKQELGLSGSTAGAVVGDSPADIGAAWNAGLDGIHLERHGHERRGCCVRADLRLTGCDQLPVRSSPGPYSSVETPR